MTPSKKQQQITEETRKKFKNRTWMGQWNDIERQEKEIQAMKDALKGMYKIAIETINNPNRIYIKAEDIGEPEPIRTTE